MMVLVSLVAVPLIGGLLAWAVARASDALARWIAVLALAEGLAASLALAFAASPAPGRWLLEARAAWIPRFGISFHLALDGLSLVLIALTFFLGLISVVVSWSQIRERVGFYHFNLLWVLAGVIGVFLAVDLFLFYFFWELMLVPMYFLIGIWGHGDGARRAALKFFLYTLAGSLAMLLAILGLYLSTDPRTMNMAEIIRQQPLGGVGWLPTLVFLGFAVAFAVKTPVVPFHTWLPPAHVDAPAPASAILAGVLLKMGTYGFIRILLAMMPEVFRRFALPLAVLALVGIVYGSLVALAQGNLKRRIAYTSVNHMGYAVLGIAAAASLGLGDVAARSLALTGATVEMVAHGLITGALFLISGSIWARAETYDLDAFGGLAARAPALTGLTAVAAFASLGLPGLAGFVAEFQVFVGTFGVYPWLAGLGLLGIIVTAALFLHLLQKVFLGPLPQRLDGWPRLRPLEVAVLGSLMLLTVAVGVYPRPLLTVIESAARTLVGG